MPLNLDAVPLFRATKKLADALRLRLMPPPLEAQYIEHEWFADLFYIERRKCVIWVHRTTLLTFARPAVTAAELRDFHGLFRYEFRTIIASLGLPERLIDRWGIYHPPSFASTSDRRVVGSMLDYRKMFDHMVDDGGGLASVDIAAINAELNNTPMSMLGMESAADAAHMLAASSSMRH